MSSKIGLVIAALLGAADVLGPSPAGVAAALHFPEATGNEQDPFGIGGPAVVGVFVAGMTLGVVTLVGVLLTFIKRSRVAARVVAAARVIAALIIAPIFLLQGLEAWILVISAALVILDITAVVLLLSRPVAPAPTT